MLVLFCVPETKGKTLERMDDVFGSAYGDGVDVELGAYRREGREKGIFGKGVVQQPVDGEREIMETIDE